MTGTAFERIRVALEQHGSRVTGTGSRLSAQCPAHDDRGPSLSLTGIDGQALLYCHAQCGTADVLGAIGLTLADLFDEPRGTEYRYDDGRTVHRTPFKKFRQTGNTKGSALYRAGKITAAVAAGHTVYVVEGEKDVHALETLSVAATCSAMGAGKASKADWTPLTGAKVVIVADRDDPGERHAADVRRILRGLHATVEIRHAATGKDAADHVAAGHGLDDLVPVDVADAKPRVVRSVDDEPIRPLPNYDPGLYDLHPVLGAIRDHAHSRCVGADALLLSVLALVSGSIPGGITIDSGLRRAVTPGLYVTLCAESGIGKTAAAGVAQDLLDVPVTYALSTGEGMLESFYGLVDVYNNKGDKTGTRRTIVRHNALFTADEGQTLFAEMAREGSKFGSILRSFWSGIGIGTANATADRNRLLPRGTYNGSVTIGLQPTLVGGLIGDTALGTAQRFLWAAAHDVYLNPSAPMWDGPLFIPPAIPRDPEGQPILSGQMFTVDSSITAELRAAEVAKMTLVVAADEHDSQRAVQLLKISATLAWIGGRLHVTAEDWILAEAILMESAVVRDALIDQAETAEREQIAAEGHKRAALKMVELSHNAVLVKVKTRLVELLQARGPMPKRDLTNGVNPKGGKRKLVPQALDELTAVGWVSLHQGSYSACSDAMPAGLVDPSDGVYVDLSVEG